MAFAIGKTDDPQGPHADDPGPAGRGPEETAAQSLVIPVVAEQLLVATRQRDTGGVRVTKTVHEQQQHVDVPLVHEQIHTERVPIGRPIDAPAQVRYEGDTLVIPVMEEIVVVEKRLILKEELRIRKIQHVIHDPQTHVLRREELRVEHLDPASPVAPGEAAPSGDEASHKEG